MNRFIRGSRTGVAVLLLLASASFFTVNSHAGKLPSSTAPQRGYYLTKDNFDGSQPLSACAAGYHMASLWEIHEPSDLRYNESLGLTLGDGGPPTQTSGWIRLGFPADQNYSCSIDLTNPWTSNSSLQKGATAFLAPPYYVLTEATVVDQTWGTLQQACDVARKVWCVQD